MASYHCEFNTIILFYIPHIPNYSHVSYFLVKILMYGRRRRAQVVAFDGLGAKLKNL